MVEMEQRWLHQARRAAFEDYRRRNATVWIAPHGGSMRPTIGTNTWMLVEFGATTIGLGDIVLFPFGNLMVAHRVVARRLRQDQIILVPKGDAEPYCDPKIQSGDVIGVVRALRDGRDGPVSGFGCSGRSAQIIARLSRLSGRGAWGARRAAIFLPDPLRRLALRVIPSLTRVVARILLAPLRWAAWFPIQTA
jgi:hypothetical protein